MTTRVIDLHGMSPAAIDATPGFVYCGRPMRFHPHPAVRRGSPLANPFKGGTLDAYRAHVLSRPDLVALLPGLRGRTLGCWCLDGTAADLPHRCHCQVLAELADGPEL